MKVIVATICLAAISVVAMLTTNVEIAAVAVGALAGWLGTHVNNRKKTSTVT